MRAAEYRDSQARLPPLPLPPVTDYYRGKTVLLTGASSGIGLEMARQLMPLGARVLLVARREDALNTLAARLGPLALVFPADLQPAEGADALVDRVHEAGETVDVLINNAGYGIAGPFVEHASGARGMTELNVSALTQLAARLVPGMAERGTGGVLNVASLGAFAPVPRMAVYAATKAYVLSFTDALHYELRSTGVHVSALCPGPVRTGFGERAEMNDAFFKGAQPVERVAQQGLDGLARNTRRVVPGVLTKLQAFAPRLVPVGPALSITDRISRKAR